MTASRHLLACSFIAMLVAGCQSAQIAPAPRSAALPAAKSSGNILVASWRARAILTFPRNGNGDIPPTSVLRGSKTDLDKCAGVFVAPDGGIYVSCFGVKSINFYARGARGDQAPARRIVGRETGLTDPLRVALDSKGYIYVSNAYPLGQATHPPDSIRVYAPNANGDVKPVRTISGKDTGLYAPYGLALNSRNQLAVVNGGNDSVTVYAAGAAGDAAPIAVIRGNSTRLLGPMDLKFDSQGNIYVVTEYGREHGSILEYSSNANGNQPPIRKIHGSSTDLSYPQGIALDAQGRMYVSNDDVNKITTYAANARGDASPMTSIEGGNAELEGPDGIALSP